MDDLVCEAHLILPLDCLDADVERRAQKERGREPFLCRFRRVKRQTAEQGAFLGGWR